MRKLLELTAMTLLLPCTLSFAAPSAGLDKAGFDPGVRVQDDLFHAVNGAWLTATPIPADKPEYGTFIQLRDRSDERVRTIVDELARHPHAPGSVAQKVGSFYASFLGTAAIDKAGLAPMQPLLAEIDAIGSMKDLARWQGQVQGLVETPVQLYVSPDAKQPTLNLVITWQGGLGLPDRDYYLKKDDERLAKARAAYLSYLAVLAPYAGEKDVDSAARRVMAIEERIAQAHWPRTELRDPAKSYNPTTPVGVAELAPGFDWASFMGAAALGGQTRLSVSQPSTTTAIAKLYADVPLADWKLYFKLHSLDAAAPVLPQALRDAHFAFHRTALTGTTAQKPRWQDAITQLNNALGEAVGELYVARHFPAPNKLRMQQLVANLLTAYAESIDGLTWMTSATKAQAQAKLAKYTTKIGYPDKWRDYSQLDIRDGDALGNDQRAGRFEWARLAAKAGKPVDRSEWGITPQTVNAYYNGLQNEIVFPAAILEPPFFDMAVDDAVNYGAIGAIIGHEISHGFDDSGSQLDGDGVLRNWWTDADRKAFEAVTARLVAQYDAYEPLPGKHLNGKLTLGENIADLSGLQIAFKAYQRALGGKPAPVIDGHSGAQRFFLGWGQAWRSKARDDRKQQLLAIDPHSPPEFRANGAAINHDGFHESFATQPGDKMFKPAADRVRLW
jgi:putative endopeptidase